MAYKSVSEAASEISFAMDFLPKANSPYFRKDGLTFLGNRSVFVEFTI